MDEILKRFESTLGTARAEDDQSHKDLYKNWGKYGNQEERRAEILRQQKSNRENNLDNCRGILNLMDCAEEKSSVFRKSSRVRYQPSVYVPGFTHSANFYYNNVLMQSEWLVERPEDFSTNWYVTPCPKGTRTLVVACNGMTRCYSKYGQLCSTTSTLLPGGNGNERLKNCSVLDCFYCKDSNTMYVLDIISWNNHIMADGEMEFRRYWLETTFKENPALEKVTKRNKISFKLLPMTSCDTESFEKFMMTYPPLTLTKLDGLLFYHKHGHYVAGETPLVGWLYPYMVTEVLCPNMAIHETYAAGKPQDYVDQATFIQKFEEKASKKKTPFSKGKKKTQSISENSMEADDGPVAQGDSVEEGMNEQNVNENTASEGGDTATMETENNENGKHGIENIEIEKYQANSNRNGENLDSSRVPFSFTGILSDQDSTQQQATITKY